MTAGTLGQLSTPWNFDFLKIKYPSEKINRAYKPGMRTTFSNRPIDEFNLLNNPAIL